MSEADLSYYHSYGENGAQGYADRLVIDDNGEVKCLFTDTDGVQKTGDYDMVPRIGPFMKNHPDFSYKGAKPNAAAFLTVSQASAFFSTSRLFSMSERYVAPFSISEAFML